MTDLWLEDFPLAFALVLNMQTCSAHTNAPEIVCANYSFSCSEWPLSPKVSVTLISR